MALQRLGGRHDHRQHVVEIVGCRTRQAADCLQLGRMLHALFLLSQRGLEAHARRLFFDGRDHIGHGAGEVELVLLKVARLPDVLVADHADHASPKDDRRIQHRGDAVRDQIARAELGGHVVRARVRGRDRAPLAQRGHVGREAVGLEDFAAFISLLGQGVEAKALQVLLRSVEVPDADALHAQGRRADRHGVGERLVAGLVAGQHVASQAKSGGLESNALACSRGHRESISAGRGNVTQQASQVRARRDFRAQAAGVPATLGAVRPAQAARVTGSFSLLRMLLALTFAALLTAAHTFLSLAPWSSFLISLAALVVLALPPVRKRSADDSAPVQSFGQYTLVRKIGEGGMGVVYEARHALLRRPTALKLLRKQDDEDPEANREAVQRFEREVQLTSQLRHPNTIAIYDYGQNEEGAFYYAMEYIDGIDLDRLVRVDGPLSPAHVIHLALQICGALAEAHARSFIHRDIKPSNVLVYERAFVTDTIKVLDFGLVKSLRGPVVSAAHVLVGTPLYTAPEVLEDPSRASARSDIYALGAVLYWLTTGKRLQEASLLGVSALAALPVDLERVILRCTDPDPSERPESMDALAAELAQCRAYGQWSKEDSRSFWEERGKRLSHLLAQPAAQDAKTLAAS
jgi:hypothetical protein